MAIVEAFEIDFVQIDPRAQIFEHFRRAVAVRHVSRRQPPCLGLLEDGHGPLARDERLIVRAHHHARVQPKRIVNEPFRRRLQRRRNGSRIAERLRRHPVLAVPTVQIASKHPEAVRERAGLRVKEWLLLDRITLNAAHIAPGNEQTSAFVEPHLADANRALRQRTAVAARVAAQPAVRQPLVQFAFARLVREHLSQCGHGLLHCSARLRALRFGARSRGLSGAGGTRIEGLRAGGRHAHVVGRRNAYLGCAVSQFGKCSGVLAAVAHPATRRHGCERRVANQQPADPGSRSRVLSDQRDADVRQQRDDSDRCVRRRPGLLRRDDRTVQPRVRARRARVHARVRAKARSRTRGNNREPHPDVSCRPGCLAGASRRNGRNFCGHADGDSLLAGA